jgi:hypothetical protein
MLSFLTPFTFYLNFTVKLHLGVIVLIKHTFFGLNQAKKLKIKVYLLVTTPP